MTAPAWQPATAAVANIVPNRTQDASGDFTTTTNPTATQVTAAITSIVAEVRSVTGVADDATTTNDLAALCCAVGAAAQIELGFTDDTAKDMESKWSQLQRRYNELLGRLKTMVNDGAGSDDPLPVYGFPDRTTSPPTTLTTDF